MQWDCSDILMFFIFFDTSTVQGVSLSDTSYGFLSTVTAIDSDTSFNIVGAGVSNDSTTIFRIRVEDEITN